ncbi:MAG: anti-phage dCTP deaminase [Vulcanimicrobiota bacterium]
MSTKLPELFFGLVGPIGTDLALLTTSLEESLKSLGYESKIIRLIELVPADEPTVRLPADERYRKLMKRGTDFCSSVRAADALALLSVNAIFEFRQQVWGETKKPDQEGILPPLPARSYIFRSIKRREEVETFRQIYGRSFFLLGAYAPHESRAKRLARLIADSRREKQPEKHHATALELIATDRKEEGVSYGQRVRDAFHLADVFFDLSVRKERLDAQVKRFIHLLFGAPYLTPTREEFCMFQAYGAALRSSALGRQVGAAVATLDGNVVALGMNEVPKKGGGAYWADESTDRRDFVTGEDSNDILKRRILDDIIARLVSSPKVKSQSGLLEFLENLQMSEPLRKEVFEGAHFADLIEFGRAVHAEMFAIVDASRRGISTQDHVMYVTTFPCHECTRHIIAAGIAEVVFIEPYPKSLAETLHDDAIQVDSECKDGSRINFRPFVGIAPRIYMDLFRMGKRRKDESGRILKWYLGAPYPRIVESAKAYLYNEIGYTSSING